MSTTLRSIRQAIERLVGAAPEGGVRRFGTFSGVFTPTVLTILGVIMYLRLTWVVGNAGLLGALAIIALSKTISICTGLSLASITTNIRIGAGGAYSIISQSLGMEAGGAIGIPFYISISLSSSLYIIGFTEGWLILFPEHDPLIVSAVTWLTLVIISAISARFAIKVQYIVMALIGLSLISILLTPAPMLPFQEIVLVGDFSQGDFWLTFAIFFPAVTGIMAGVNMSGELINPRRAITRGTISAIIMTSFIYIGLAVAAALFIPHARLLDTSRIAFLDIARWQILIILGILAATYSSALGSMVGAPRILQALALQRTVPFSGVLARLSRAGEPRNAIILTGVVVFVAIVFGNLDALASLITMFFLITYGSLNIVVFIQQSMRFISFRPTFRVPRVVPLIGSIGSIFTMFLISPLFSVVALVVIVILYIWLERRSVESEWGDIRGGMFLALAERISRVADRFPRHHVNWKPDLLVPIEDPRHTTIPLQFLHQLTDPAGSIYAFTVRTGDSGVAQNQLDVLMAPLSGRRLPVRTAVIDDADFVHGSEVVIQTLRATVFRPNTLFLTIGSSGKKDAEVSRLIEFAGANELGVAILKRHAAAGFGDQKIVNLWLRPRSPNWHLATLLAMQMQINWNGRLNLITAVHDGSEVPEVESFLNHLGELARFPQNTEFHVLSGSFEHTVRTAPAGDLTIIGLAAKIDLLRLRALAALFDTTCLFVKDSGRENALV